MRAGFIILPNTLVPILQVRTAYSVIVPKKWSNKSVVKVTRNLNGNVGKARDNYRDWTILNGLNFFFNSII